MNYPRLARTRLMLFGLLTILLICLLPLQGCATNGQPQVVRPKDFGQTEIFTMAIATEVLSQADILLAGGVIRPEDARSLVRQTDQVRADVNLAKIMNVTQPATALQRINLSLQTIQGVRNYLATRGATFTPAASG